MGIEERDAAYSFNVMAKTKHILGWLLTGLAVVATLAMPAMASIGAENHHNASPTEIHNKAAHSHHMMHGDEHGSHHHQSASEGQPDAHDHHGWCNMMACCPVASMAPRLDGRTVLTERAPRQPDLGCLFSQARPDTSDKPPRYI
ncbi:MAG: hypothetical protein AAFQ21_12030 [Pseudomonadota bacterium]